MSEKRSTVCKQCLEEKQEEGLSKYQTIEMLHLYRDTAFCIMHPPLPGCAGKFAGMQMKKEIYKTNNQLLKE